MKTAPRMRLWQEASAQRMVMTPEGPTIAYEGEWVLIVVGKSLEDCVKQFCPMLRMRGDFEPEKTK